jgi:hypothetical protein
VDEGTEEKGRKKKTEGQGNITELKEQRERGKETMGKEEKNRETEQGGDKGQNDRETSGNRNTGEMK